MQLLRTLLFSFSFVATGYAQTCEALFTFDATPLTIHFEDISTHAPNDPIVSWDWDFDDGTGSSAQHPVHTFPEPERYDVNLTITTQSGCNSNIEIRIEICDFGVDYTIGNCDPDGFVPVSFTITDIFDNADEIDVILDGQNVPGSPFEIDAQNPVNVTVMVPGNGLEHTINIQSTDIETCGRTIVFTTEDCSSDCFLGSLNVEFTGGTTHNVTVGNDFFSPQSIAIVLGDVVHFVWQGSGHSTTSDAVSGPDSWNSGVIGSGSTFDVNIQNPGTHNYYCQPHGGPGGVGMSGQILSNCPTGNSMPLVVSFNTTIANPAGYDVLWDNVAVPGSPFDYNGVGPQSVTINIAGDGMEHSLVVRDVADPSCDIALTYNAPDCNQGGGTPVCSISASAGNFGGCNNNTVTADLTVNVTNGGSGFNVSIDNGPNTFYSYTGNTTVVTINLPGDGLSHSIEVTDDADPACTDLINTVTPNCSLPCSITNLAATPASGNGGPSGIVHTVNVEDFQFNPSVINITSGDLVQWVWTGAIAHTSTSDAISGQDSWDSGLLNNGATYTSPLLSEGTHPYYCIPHGAPGGVGMSGTIFVLPPCNANGETNVLVEFDIVSNGTEGFQVLVDGVVAGTFPYTGGNAQSATVPVPGDAMSHTIVVRDVADPSCTATTNVVTPDCGGGNMNCSVSVNATVSGPCANNQVPVSLDVNAANNGPDFSVTVDGNNAGTFSYSDPDVVVNVIGDGNSHTIVVTDSNDPACTASTSVVTPDCSLPCSISNISAVAAGSGGGSGGIEHIVNVEDFQFNPSVLNITVGDVVRWNWTGTIPHTSTSDVSGTPNSWDSGLLSNGSTFTSPVLEEGVYGYYCVPHGAPGGVGMSGTIHVLPECNSLGEITVQVSFDIINGSSSGYNVLVDGNNAGNFTYVAGASQSASVLVPGDGLPHILVIQDLSEPSCNGTVTITTPDCSGGGNGACEISVSPAISGGCTNGLVPVTLNVTANNQSNSFTVTVDGQPGGTFLYSEPAVVNIAGDGQAHTIVITDAEDPACTATASITTTDCSLPCSIQISEINFGQSIQHTVQVQDFQFSPQEISVNLGDTVLFSWTGVIPHTVTSDAPSGPNSFNSGLLGQGSTWQWIPQATGTFPYYCIPHGAPGGIGMSGIIHVESACEGNIANGTMQIQYANVSGQGFNVKLDGIPVQGSPFTYVPGGSASIPLALTGDGNQHVLLVEDAGDTTCSAQQTIVVPSCDPACSLNLSQITLGNCIGNTVALDLAFTSNQLNATYNVYKDGLKLNAGPLTTDANGNGSYSTLIVGNGSAANITVQFIGNGACSATQTITVPSCAGPCLISDLEVGTHAGNIVVEVRDFEFFPATVDALAGDTIHFIWTGVTPHTTTSDALSGPNSWNSGLLGQGSAFNVVIGEAGTYPYYCQPHGGPGGIGMSGVINVLDTCHQEKWRTHLSFNVSAGSPLGYNVFVDGVKITPDPLQYDDPVGSNTEIIELPGDAAWHLVTVQDLETGFCAYTQPVFTSLCGAGCSVINLTANTGGNILHTVEVRDFDYYPENIVVGAGETIRFVWTGQIPHTVTSDAITGPVVFNSGLLGEGATFDLVINDAGEHPFFCIPHGGPGGIGMSGSITVVPACADNQQHVQLQFEVTNGSLQGYNLFVDGMPYGNNPRPYQDRKGSNEVNFTYPADNSQHIVTIQDVQNNICAASDFFTMGTCDASCALSGLDYFLGNGRVHEVEVKDFEYSPKEIQVELGDTIRFIWTGAIPHTVTSDVPTGDDAFNSGLLPQGAQFDVVPLHTGTHAYYCIPHGAPGGIGMTGKIHVGNICDDGKVNVDFRFFSEGVGQSYDVLNNNQLVIDNQAYLAGGIQNFTLELNATGQTHQIAVKDTGADSCMTGITLDSFDCNDPCFLVRSAFDYDIDFSSNEVVFYEKSKGNIVTWHWEFGDGNTSSLKNPAHSYAEATLYEVCLTVTDANGCMETFCDKIRLGANACEASFTYAQDGLELLFHNTSDVSDPNAAITWTFGDGNSSTLGNEVVHTYNSGLFEACLTVTATGCVSTHCEILDLTDPCLVLRSDYEANVDPGNNLSYQFTDMSSGPVASRLWGFGDGQISYDENPSHTYSATGVYTVCLLIMDDEGNCTDSDCRTLYVGTTGVDPAEVRMKKLQVAPNPVSLSSREVRLTGFDPLDIGSKTKIWLHDMTGMPVMKKDVTLVREFSLIMPEIPGVYFLQVVTELNRYGAMIAVQ